jgi:hypothetical protein
MAAIANVTEFPLQDPNLQLVVGTVTTTGDTYVSKFSAIKAVFVNDQTTKGGASATYTGGTVTVACTNGDVVDLLIIGVQ